MNDAVLRMTGSIQRRTLLLSLALIAVAGVVAARTLVSGGDSGERLAAQAPIARTTASQVAQLEQRLRERPNDVGDLSQLASAYSQRARETGDPSFYPLAETAVQRALALEPANVQALDVASGLALSRHDFTGALLLGERARDIAPSVVATYAVITDAMVELGRYEEAIVTAQQLADLRPNFAAYSRISYIRELHGDLDGAIAAMQQAVNAGSGVKQDVVWGRVLLGNLYLAKNDIPGAAFQYQQAAAILPDDPQAQFGLSKLATAQGDYATAETQLRAAIAQRPLPEYVIALGDLLFSQGRQTEAEGQYALVRVEEQLLAANGVDTDIELALFDADHDTAPEQTYQKALAAYERRPSVYAADTVAWAAYKAGHLDDAHAYVTKAMRLGTRDPRLSYHSGVIAGARGDRATAIHDLTEALAAAPALSLRYAASARTALRDLNDAGTIQP